MKQTLQLTLCSLAAAVFLSGCAMAPTSSSSSRHSSEEGFVRLFDGKTLDGWELLGKKGDGYYVADGMIVCAKGGGGNLLTKKTYANFILRFEFKLDPASNNGVGIRAPLTDKQVAYEGMEIQILDVAYNKPLKPTQYHGSIYDVFPAKTGALNQSGMWNEQEIIADGRRVKVILNGQTIVDADLNSVTDPAVLAKHPGLLRDRGHVGFLGHNDYVAIRNVRLKELPDSRKLGSPLSTDNVAPAGFKSLFNGRDLTGWKGLLARPNDNPLQRATLAKDKLAAEQAKADAQMLADWKVENGAIVYRGAGFNNLVSARDYANFEMFVDWKINSKGDSGLYLRGNPQVQIWDTLAEANNQVGSGGLFNNKDKKNPSVPLVRADHLTGEWNRFHILMVGDKATITLNGQVVVRNTTLENFWAKGQPLPASGPIELQAHKTPVWFKNIYVRELPAASTTAPAK
jgi:hypothetical protein